MNKKNKDENDFDTNDFITYEKSIKDNILNDRIVKNSHIKNDNENLHKNFFGLNTEQEPFEDIDVIKAKEKIFKREKKKRVKRQITIAVTCVLFIILIFCILSVTVLFNINEFQIVGCNIYKKDDIIKEASLNYGENLFKINKQHITAKLKLAFPYIEDVKIKRVLPHKLLIDIKQATETSAIKTKDGFIVLSDTNKILKVNQKQAPPNVTLIEGVLPHNVIVGNYLSVENKSDILKEIYDNIKLFKITDIKLIDIKDTKNIRINISDNRVILLGDEQNMHYKFSMYSEINNNYLSTNEKVIVNCTNPKRCVASPIK